MNGRHKRGQPWRIKEVEGSGREEGHGGEEESGEGRSPEKEKSGRRGVRERKGRILESRWSLGLGGGLSQTAPISPGPPCLHPATWPSATAC